MKKLGIFGGTFNPIHNGHIHLALSVREQLGLDEILVIPANMPPHKECPDLAPPLDRLAMCRLACQDYPFLRVSDIEVRQQGRNYTYNTLVRLQEEYPDSRFFLMMGSDMFLTFEEWRNYQGIMKLAVLCTAPREEGQLAALLDSQKRYEAMGATVRILSHFQVLELSSTQVRRQLISQGSTGGLLNPRVEQYILEHELYEEKSLIRPGSREDA